MHYNQNKKFIDPRYFLHEEQAPNQPTSAQQPAASPASQAPQKKEDPLDAALMDPTNDTIGDPSESSQYRPGTQQPVASGTGAIIERARSLVGKGWTYSLQAFGGQPQGGPQDPKPDPAKIPFGSEGAYCDCTGFASWATGRWQKTSPWSMGLTNNLGEPALNPMPGDIIFRGPIAGAKHGHVGIVSAVTPENATVDQINKGQGDVTVIHCSSSPAAGQGKMGAGAVVEKANAIKSGWAGSGQNKVPVMFFRPTKIKDDKYLQGSGNKAVAANTVQRQQQVKKESIRREKMRVEKWDILMNKLLEEQKEKQLKEKRFAGKKELDKDGDGVPTWADKDDSNPKVGSKKSSKKKGGKVPSQLKMHIKKKKKLDIDKEIKKLEESLFIDGDPEKGFLNEGFGSLVGSLGKGLAKGAWDMAKGAAVDYAINKGVEYATNKFLGNAEKPAAPTQKTQSAQATQQYGDEDDEEEYYDEEEDKDPMDLEEVQDDLLEYGEGRYPDMAEEDDDDDFEDEDFEDVESDEDFEEDEEDFDYDFEDEEGDEEYGDESMESEEMSDMDSEGFEDMMEEVEYLSEAEVKKKQPRLGKVTRNPSGSKKKFHVYVKCGGRVKKISFGDPGLSIKRDSAARRKNFRARHKCDKPAGKDRCTARYWSCYQWRAGKKVEGE